MAKVLQRIGILDLYVFNFVFRVEYLAGHENPTPSKIPPPDPKIPPLARKSHPPKIPPPFIEAVEI
jgi:hypothetical protein